ncbi:MAG: cupin domain-containing protein [Candidatus Omnitrophica bacterium]|nr:cupin domain-containing protein [Candidatus Omnitrophota bacterium]
MQLHQYLTQIRKDKKLKIQHLHNKIKKIFAKKAVSYRSLLRILQGHTQGRESSLYQVCIGLGITPAQLKENIMSQPDAIDYIKRSLRKDKYIYNENASAELLAGPERSFLTMELTLKAKGKTKPQGATTTEVKSEKWVYGLFGKTTCVIDDKTYQLDKGDCLSFNGNLPHYFKNKTSKKAQCLIVQTPRPQEDNS